ncbi:MAG TPA: hypothetical protein VEF53_02560 [Patescibacteria group bacterium]|nr:hypothetical protein [Patescibacteria group bacterium]
MKKIFFVLFISLTGFIEIGTVIFAIKSSYTINQLVMLVLAYQIGHFFSSNIRLSKKYIYMLSVSSTLMYLLTIIHKTHHIYLLFATLFVSICLQTIRSINKIKISTGLKRTLRILGFAFSPLFSISIMVFISIIIFISCHLSNIKQSNIILFEKIKLPYYIMITHQIHYFSYSYLILIKIFEVDNFNGFFTSGMFVLGWITYTATPYMLRKRSYERYFIFGHISLFIILVSMYFLNNLYIKIILWVLTGFGAATVFCIERIFAKNRIQNKHQLDLSENTGHIMGLCSGLLIYNLFHSIDSVIMSAGVYALLTAIMMLRYLKTNTLEE